MSEINFSKLKPQAKKIVEDVAYITKKLRVPSSLGAGDKAEQTLDDIIKYVKAVKVRMETEVASLTDVNDRLEQTCEKSTEYILSISNMMDEMEQKWKGEHGYVPFSETAPPEKVEEFNRWRLEVEEARQRRTEEAESTVEEGEGSVLALNDTVSTVFEPTPSPFMRTRRLAPNHYRQLIIPSQDSTISFASPDQNDSLSTTMSSRSNGHAYRALPFSNRF